MVHCTCNVHVVWNGKWTIVNMRYIIRTSLYNNNYYSPQLFTENKVLRSHNVCQYTNNEGQPLADVLAGRASTFHTVWWVHSQTQCSSHTCSFISSEKTPQYSNAPYFWSREVSLKTLLSFPGVYKSNPKIIIKDWNTLPPQTSSPFWTIGWLVGRDYCFSTTRSIMAPQLFHSQLPVYRSNCVALDYKLYWITPFCYEKSPSCRANCMRVQTRTSSQHAARNIPGLISTAHTHASTRTDAIL